MRDEQNKQTGHVPTSTSHSSSTSVSSSHSHDIHGQRGNNKVDASFDNVVSRIRGLDIAPKSTSNSKDSRCDSGIIDERVDSIDSQYNSQDEPWIPASSNFNSLQIIDIFRGDEDGDNHLHLAIIHAQPALALHVIALAPHQDWLGEANLLQQTPLHLAVTTRQPLVVRRLMTAGARTDAADAQGNTPLHTACRLGFEDVVRVLLTPVRYEETYQNRYPVTLRHSLDLDAKNYDGLTCLHLAALAGQLGVMRLLLAAGANVNTAEGKGGRTVLHLAADWGHQDMLRLLLESRDVDVDAASYAGATPLVLAVGRAHAQAVAALYRKGADVAAVTAMQDAETSDEEMT